MHRRLSIDPRPWILIGVLSLPWACARREALARAAGGEPDHESPRALHAPAAAGQRSLWVWRTPAPQVLVGFAESTGVQRLYYAVRSPLTDEQLLRDEALISLAHSHGIRVLALGGRSSWGTPRGVSAALAWEDEVVQSGAAFDGVALDIEPKDCSNDGGGQAFVAAMEAIRANAPAVDLEMAQRDSYGTTPYGIDGYATLADALDATGINEVEIMSYRNSDYGGSANSNDQYGVALPDMEAAYAAHVRATLGAETSDIGPVEITFYGMSYQGMRAVLAQTDALESASGFTNYRGISIEDYFAFRRLVDGPPKVLQASATHATPATRRSARTNVRAEGSARRKGA